jgi:hypothetical protein
MAAKIAVDISNPPICGKNGCMAQTTLKIGGPNTQIPGLRYVSCDNSELHPMGCEKKDKGLFIMVDENPKFKNNKRPAITAPAGQPTPKTIAVAPVTTPVPDHNARFDKIEQIILDILQAVKLTHKMVGDIHGASIPQSPPVEEVADMTADA